VKLGNLKLYEINEFDGKILVVAILNIMKRANKVHHLNSL